MMVSIYRKGGSPQRLAEAYDRTVGLMGTPVESRHAVTSYGRTHYLAAGPAGAPALVLFHGFCFSSSGWVENIRELSSAYRVYAVDLPGDINKSEPERLIRSKKDCAEWFEELLQAFGIGHAHIGGHSYGGFVAMIVASLRPSLVDKLVILSPGAGVLPQSSRFFVRCMLAGFLPSERRIHALLDDMTGEGNTINPMLRRQVVVALQNALPKVKLLPSLLTDDELKRITAPALLLIGDQEVQYDAERAVSRARAVMPDVRAHVIRDAGHGLPLEKPGEVNGLILDFLGEARLMNGVG
ncbi:alpha/beta fold hydrolase [Paenibacillus sabinae]|nr:alpha/beta hydrolase [Paenibacillus sabinae]